MKKWIDCWKCKRSGVILYDPNDSLQMKFCEVCYIAESTLMELSDHRKSLRSLIKEKKPDRLSIQTVRYNIRVSKWYLKVMKVKFRPSKYDKKIKGRV